MPASGIVNITLGTRLTSQGFPGIASHDQVVAQMAPGQSGTLSYAFSGSHPSWISIDANTGAIQENPPVGAAPGNQPLTILVTNTRTGGSTSFRTSFYLMPTATVAAGTVGPNGGTIADARQSVVLVVPAGAVSASTRFAVLRGTQADKTYAYTVNPAPSSSVPSQLYLPDPYLRAVELQQQAAAHSGRASADAQAASAESPGPITNDRTTAGGWVQWQQWKANFLIFDERKGNVLPRGNRLPNDLAVAVPPLDDVSRINSPAAELWSLCGDRSHFAATTCAGKEPVIFIHGFDALFELGGGSGTWASFPEEVCNPNVPCTPTEPSNRYAVFEFTWNTFARFQDAADDLAYAIDAIHQATGRPVHIVAHSFGGLLARAYVEGLAVRRGGGLHAYANDVASLTTLGTPHSGIFPGDGQQFGQSFPNGQDNLLIPLCLQPSCNDAGQPTPAAYTWYSPDSTGGTMNLSDKFGESGGAGSFVNQLAFNLKANKLPVPTQVLIGLTAFNGSFEHGDALISYRGQRLHPDLSCTSGSCSDTQLAGLASQYGRTGIPMVEHILGFPDESLPGGHAPPGLYKGYRHTISSIALVFNYLRGEFGENGVGAGGKNNCKDGASAHPAFGRHAAAVGDSRCWWESLAGDPDRWLAVGDRIRRRRRVGPR